MSKIQAATYKNSQHSRVMILKYKTKYLMIKKQIKNLIIENAALCDEVAQTQLDLTMAREERKFLAERLMQHEGLEAVTKTQKRPQKRQQQTQKPQNKQEKLIPKQENQFLLQVHSYAAPNIKTINHTHSPRKRGPKKRVGSNIKPVKSDKRTTKVRDKLTLDANGVPMFPINLFNVLVHSAGEIITINPNFHNTQWIYPVGYVSTRIYAHPKNPQKKCVYTCKILNNAGMPQFQIIPDNDLDSVFFGETASVCHQKILEALQCTLAGIVNLPLCINGEKFFGLANSTVISLLQMDPGYKYCRNFKGFVVETDEKFSLPEEKDPTINFEALQSLIAQAAYNTVPEIKDQPPDVLLQLNDSFNALH